MKSSSNDIIQANILDVIEWTLNDISDNDIVVFDCDDVLTTITQQLFKQQNRQFFLDWCKINIPGFNRTMFFDLLDYILVSNKNVLVNDKMPCLVNKLADNNIKSIVLTALPTKPIGKIQEPIKWRSKILSELGYNFGKFWKNLPNKTFFEDTIQQYPPAYHDGIICCDNVPKHLCLSKFLQHSNISPSCTVFIDDNIDNLNGMQQWAHDNNIQFVGIQYLEAQNIVSNIPFSEELINYQLHNLVERRIWISDDDAFNAISEKI